MRKGYGKKSKDRQPTFGNFGEINFNPPIPNGNFNPHTALLIWEIQTPLFCLITSSQARLFRITRSVRINVEVLF